MHPYVYSLMCLFLNIKLLTRLFLLVATILGGGLHGAGVLLTICVHGSVFASGAYASEYGPFVFAYFHPGQTGQRDGLQLAYSRDGLRWERIESGKSSFMRPEVGGKLFRDPSIVQGPDETFHMVWTTDWWRQGIGIAHSKDLINWSEQGYLDVMKDFPGYINCWAPEIYYDEGSETFLIFWAATVPGHFPETEGNSETFTKPGVEGVKSAHRMYFTTTRDFETYSPTELFYDDGYNCIDAFIVQDKENGTHVMVIKDEERYPEVQKNLRLAFSDTPFGPWSKSTEPITPSWVEGPAFLKVGSEWYLYYDAYTRNRYEGMKTRDFKNWHSITDQLEMPKNMRHGTPFPVSEDVLDALIRSGEQSLADSNTPQ